MLFDISTLKINSRFGEEKLCSKNQLLVPFNKFVILFTLPIFLILKRQVCALQNPFSDDSYTIRQLPRGVSSTLYQYTTSIILLLLADKSVENSGSHLIRGINFLPDLHLRKYSDKTICIRKNQNITFYCSSYSHFRYHRDRR